MEYYSSKTVTQMLGVTAQTLRNWDKENKLHIIGYARVSSKKNKVMI